MVMGDIKKRAVLCVLTAVGTFKTRPSWLKVTMPVKYIMTNRITTSGADWVWSLDCGDDMFDS